MTVMIVGLLTFRFCGQDWSLTARSLLSDQSWPHIRVLSRIGLNKDLAVSDRFETKPPASAVPDASIVMSGALGPEGTLRFSDDEQFKKKAWPPVHDAVFEYLRHHQDGKTTTLLLEQVRRLVCQLSLRMCSRGATELGMAG